MGHYANECKNDKETSGNEKHVTFAMMFRENSEEEEYENGEEENKQESRNPDDDERKVDLGTVRNTEEPQGTSLMQSYVSNVFMTGIMSEWVMSMIVDNVATPRVPRSVQAWIESSKHGKDDKSQNMINVQLASERSKIEHRSSNISHPGENVACAQPSVSHEEEEIQNLNFEYESSKHPSEDPEEDDRKSAAKRIKAPEDEAQSWAQEEQIEKPELIEEKLNQKFPEEVETRENQDIESDEEVTSETEETDDDSETNNENVDNYLDSANMAPNLESAMKIAEEEDLWIGDSGASSHMMGSEDHVFNKKLISGSMRTTNGAHMKMLCEGDINVDVITKNGDVTSGTLRVKDIPGMKQKLFSFTQGMLGGWSMQGGQTKQGELL